MSGIPSWRNPMKWCRVTIHNDQCPDQHNSIGEEKQLWRKSYPSSSLWPCGQEKNTQQAGTSEILDNSKVEVSSFGTKAGIGKTGVHLRYNNPPEYATLSKDQKEELCEWWLKNPNRKGRTKGRDNKIPNRNKYIDSAMDKQVEKSL